MGVADEETSFFLVGVDKQAGDAFLAVAADFAGVGVEDVHAVDFDLDLIVGCSEDFDIGLSEYDEQIALPGVLQVVGHVEVGVRARLDDEGCG